MSKTIVLIHGAWLSPASWDGFRSRYEAQGFRVVAPGWPYDDRPVVELRRSPNPALARVGIKEIVDHYEMLIRALPESPIIMGHSFGGLFVQLLLDRGLGTAGVAIDPGAPRGVLPGPLTLRTALPIFTAWNGWKRILTMSFEDFASGFANKLPQAQQRAAYDRYIVPTPGRIYWQGAFGIHTKVNWSNPNRAPLLLTAAEFDRTVQSSMVRANYRKQLKAPSVTALKEFPKRSHFLCVEPGWEEVADYALEWAITHGRAGSQAPTYPASSVRSERAPMAAAPPQ